MGLQATCPLPSGQAVLGRLSLEILLLGCPEGAFPKGNWTRLGFSLKASQPRNLFHSGIAKLEFLPPGMPTRPLGIWEGPASAHLLPALHLQDLARVPPSPSPPPPPVFDVKPSEAAHWPFLFQTLPPHWLMAEISRAFLTLFSSVGSQALPTKTIAKKSDRLHP